MNLDQTVIKEQVIEMPEQRSTGVLDLVAGMGGVAFLVFCILAGVHALITMNSMDNYLARNLYQVEGQSLAKARAQLADEIDMVQDIRKKRFADMALQTLLTPEKRDEFMQKSVARAVSL